jgi:hypothetical protein
MSLITSPLFRTSLEEILELVTYVWQVPLQKAPIKFGINFWNSFVLQHPLGSVGYVVLLI